MHSLKTLSLQLSTAFFSFLHVFLNETFLINHLLGSSIFCRQRSATLCPVANEFNNIFRALICIIINNFARYCLFNERMPMEHMWIQTRMSVTHNIHFPFYYTSIRSLLLSAPFWCVFLISVVLSLLPTYALSLLFGGD